MWPLWHPSASTKHRAHPIVVSPPVACHPCTSCHPYTLQVRLNVLSQLMTEAYDHLHSSLCASVLGRRLFSLPFQREVDLQMKEEPDLNVERANAMRACMELCQQVRMLSKKTSAHGCA